MKKFFAALMLAVGLLIVASPVNAEVKDFELDTDVITTKSRVVLQVIEAVPKWEGFEVSMTVKVEINVEELNKWLEQEAKKSK